RESPRVSSLSDPSPGDRFGLSAPSGRIARGASFRFPFLVRTSLRVADWRSSKPPRTASDKRDPTRNLHSYVALRVMVDKRTCVHVVLRPFAILRTCFRDAKATYENATFPIRRGVSARVEWSRGRDRRSSGGTDSGSSSR